MFIRIQETRESRKLLSFYWIFFFFRNLSKAQFLFYFLLTFFFSVDILPESQIGLLSLLLFLFYLKLFSLLFRALQILTCILFFSMLLEAFSIVDQILAKCCTSWTFPLTLIALMMRIMVWKALENLKVYPCSFLLVNFCTYYESTTWNLLRERTLTRQHQNNTFERRIKKKFLFMN